jgi:beta-lactamase regulating signal transducer with metallopeptidase domain
MTIVPVEITLRATALVGAAAIVDLALRRRASAATRHLVWTLAIAALLVLPIASASLPEWQVRIPVPRAAAASMADSTAVIGRDLTLNAASTAVSGSDMALQAEPSARRSPLEIALVAMLALYLAGVAILIARLACEPFVLGRLIRESEDVTDPSWREPLADAAALLHVGRRVRLLHSCRDVMPLTFGTLSPVIVLPASAGEWSDDRRRAVLLHELAHVARHDCLIQRITAVATAIYWPHPGVWWAARRLRVERELACDDRVLSAGAEARDYAGHLLELAHVLGASPAPATALGMARARQLEQRLLAILDAARNRAALPRRGRYVALAIALTVFLPMAALRAAVVPFDTAPLTATALSLAPAAFVQSEFTGTWDLHQTQTPGVVQLNVRTAHGSHGRTIHVDQLTGLPTDKISSASAPVHFPIRRDAGTFTIDGVCRSGACAGTYSFEPDPAYADMLAKRGIGRPSAAEQFALAVADVGPAYLDALAAAGYGKPDIQTLVRAAQHGVDIAYLRDMSGLGYRLGTLDGLIQLRDHGVDPEYVRGMAANGHSHLSVADLVRARDHGVDPSYIHDLASLGFGGLSLADLITARDHGIDPEYVHGMQALGFRLTLDGYLQTRNHGVDPEYVGAMAKLGYGGLTVEGLINARNHGVDPEYVNAMATLGYKSAPLDTLVRMRDHGVDPEYVRRLQQKGIPHLTVDELIQRRDRGEDNPDATVQLIASRIRRAWVNVRTWLRG